MVNLKILLVLFLTLSLPTFASGEQHSNENAEIFLAQSVSIDELNRLLNELKRSGRVPPNATLCTVNWAQFGIVANLVCRSNLDTVLNGSISDTHKQDSEQNIRLSACDPTASNFVSCTVAATILACIGNEITPRCNSARSRAFAATIASIGTIETVHICNAVLAAILEDQPETADLTGLPSCRPGDDRSWVDTQNTAIEDRPAIFAEAYRLGGEPPVFTAFTVFRPPKDNDDAGMWGGKSNFERFDVLVYWAFDHRGIAELRVEPLFAMSGAYRVLTRNEPLSDWSFEQANNRRTNLLPSRIADQIRESLRDAGLQP